jgi:Leucine-rich repeat (LRR) protein
MIIELILLVLGFNFFKQISSVNLDCNLSADPSYESLFSVYNETLSGQSNVCGFKVGEDQKDLNLDTELNNQDAQLIVYTTTSIPILPPELFKNLPRMNRCIFYNLSTTVVDRDWFKHAQGLKQLIFYRSEIPVLEDGKFADLENLLELNLKECGVEQIEIEAFLFLGKLEKLILDGNKLTVLHPNLFKDLPTLKELHISNNPITNLSSSIFQNVVNLENFFMSGTSLATLPRYIFKNNRKLRTIDLQDGKLSKLSNKMFSDLMDLESLNLKNNSCISELISNDGNGILIGPLVEDLLAPCSCSPVKAFGMNLTLVYFLIYLGLVTGIFLVLFICKRKFFRTDNKVRKMNSSFRIKDGDLFGFQSLSNELLSLHFTNSHRKHIEGLR